MVEIEIKKELAKKAHANAVEKGFWDGNHKLSHYLMLVITEMAELIDAERNGKFAKIQEFENSQELDFVDSFVKHVKNTVEDEAADIYIRLMDIAGKRNLEFKNYDFSIKDLETTDYLFFIITSFGVNMTKMVLDDNVNDMILYVELFAEQKGIDLLKHVELKMKYNATRPPLHGKSY